MLGIERSALYIQIEEEHHFLTCKLNLNDILGYKLWSVVFSGILWNNFPPKLLEDTLFCFRVMM